MKAITFIVISLLFFQGIVPAFAERWLPLAQVEDCTYALDKRSVTQDKTFIYYAMGETCKPPRVMKEKKVGLILLLTKANCQIKQVGQKAAKVYDMTGNLIQDDVSPEVHYKSPKSGTSEEIIFNYVCKTIKDKTLKPLPIQNNSKSSNTNNAKTTGLKTKQVE